MHFWVPPGTGPVPDTLWERLSQLFLIFQLGSGTGRDMAMEPVIVSVQGLSCRARQLGGQGWRLDL